MARKPNGQGVDLAAAAMGYAERHPVYSAPRGTKQQQLLDDLGHRLPPRRLAPIEGAPRRAVPGWYSLAVDRWAS
jgi:hypothetical protein